jgi:hypothetical protein
MKKLGATTDKPQARPSAPATPKPKTDPWLSDDERKAEVNARRRCGWIKPSRGWLKGR